MLDPWADDQRYFFVHVMKVGGFSLVRMIKDNVYDSRYVYPNQDHRDFAAYANYDYVRNLSEEHRSAIKVFAGHVPLAAAPYFGRNLKTFAFFRDPVERAISHMKHTVQRVPLFKGWDLERLYEHPGFFEAFLADHQTRFFSIATIEEGESILDRMTLGPSDYERAVVSVQKLDFIGLLEDYEASVRDLFSAFDWPLGKMAHINRTQDADVSPWLRARLTRDLEIDRRFYDFVRGLYYERKTDRARGGA